MKEAIEAISILLIVLAVLLFFGPIIVVISIIGYVKIGPLRIDLRRTSKFIRVLLALVGVSIWLSVYLPLINFATRGMILEPRPVPTLTLPSTATNTPDLTQPPGTLLPMQTVLIRRSCGSTYIVEASRPIELLYGFWMAKGLELLEHNARHMTVRLLIDGQVVQGVQRPPASMSEIPCGTTLPGAYWIAYAVRLEPLPVGEHLVEFTYIFDEQVTDGYDSNGDGNLDLFGPGEWGQQQYKIIAVDH